MAHAQKPHLFFQRKGRVHLNWRGGQFSQLLTAEVCGSAVVMLDTPCSEVVWRVLATHSIRQFPLQFPSCASPCANTFQLEFTTGNRGQLKCDGTRAECRSRFRRNGRVHLNRRGRQFSRLLAAEICASAVVMLDTPCSEVVWGVLATHSIRMFPLHFPYRASPCAVRFLLNSTLTVQYFPHKKWRQFPERSNLFFLPPPIDTSGDFTDRAEYGTVRGDRNAINFLSLVLQTPQISGLITIALGTLSNL